jgi:hypothetical protein
MSFLESKTTWLGTSGLASASQLVDKTSGPVVVVRDTDTAPRHVGKLDIIHVVLQDTVKRLKEIGFSRVKRRRRPAKQRKNSKKP